MYFPLLIFFSTTKKRSDFIFFVRKMIGKRYSLNSENWPKREFIMQPALVPSPLQSPLQSPLPSPLNIAVKQALAAEQQRLVQRIQKSSQGFLLAVHYGILKDPCVKKLGEEEDKDYKHVFVQKKIPAPEPTPVAQKKVRQLSE